MGNQAVDRALDARDVRTARTGGSTVVWPPVWPSAAPAVWGRIDVVDEPRERPDRGTYTQGPVLAGDEDLEVIVDHGFGHACDLCLAPGMKQDGVAAESIGLTGDRGLGAMERAGDLPMARAR